ncbi:MAG: MFS transporter [Anaerolineae bacterium]
MTDVPISTARALASGLRAYPRDFYLLLLATLLLFANLHVVLPVLPLYVEQIGRPSDVGLVIGAASLGALVSRPLVSRWVDTLGRRPVLLSGSAVFVSASLLYGWSPSIPLLVPIRLLHGFGITLFTGAYAAFAVDLSPAGRRGEALGMAGLSFPVSLLFVPTLGVALLQAAGFIPVFLAAALAAAAAGGVLLVMREPPHNPGERGQGRGFWQVLRAPGVRSVALLRLAMGVSFGAILAFLPLFVIERGLGNTGLFFSAYGLALLMIPVPAGRISDRVGRPAVIGAGTTVAALALALLSGLGAVQDMIILGLIFGGGFGGARVALDAHVADSVVAQERGTAFGAVFAAFDLGIGVGSLLLGLLAGALGYANLYLLAGILFGMAGAVTVFLIRRETRLTAEPAS